MHLAPMRFTKIEGTAVAVTVTSVEEAKAALKELRHRKRELKFLRTALVRQQKARLAKRTGRARRAKGKAEPGMLETFVSDMKWGVAALANGVTPVRGESARSPAEIDQELRHTDEMLHNIQGCILQLEGKLLAKG